MSKAPRPTPNGIEAERAQDAEDARVTVFTVGDEDYRLAIRNVRLSEKLEVKKQTGMSWSIVIGEDGAPVGIESLAVFVWLARRAAGEPGLRWAVFESQWDPTVNISDIEVRTEDPVGNDPEA